MNTNEPNLYAPPSPGSEAGVSVGFVLSDHLRALIVKTATLMMIAGCLQMIPGVLGVISGGMSASGLISAAVFGVIPAFVLIAGFTLRSVAKQGDDLDALMAGFRSLFIAFLIKGVVLLTIVGVFLLGIASMALGVGVGFAKLFG